MTVFLVIVLLLLFVALLLGENIRKEISGLIETWYLKGDKDLMDHINDTSVLYTEEELLW